MHPGSRRGRAGPDRSSAAAARARGARLVAACQDLRGHRLPWLARAFGTGVGTYFALPAEPRRLVGAGRSALSVAALGWLAWRGRGRRGVRGPASRRSSRGGLAARRSAPLRRRPGARLPLLRRGRGAGGRARPLRLRRAAPHARPGAPRPDGPRPTTAPRPHLAARRDRHAPRPGARVMTTAISRRPPGPTEPGGFDFQRHAWFDSLGAVGYARVPLLLAAPPRTARRSRSRAPARPWRTGFVRACPARPGQVAAAITTGDRSGLSEQVTAKPARLQPRPSARDLGAAHGAARRASSSGPCAAAWR